MARGDSMSEVMETFRAAVETGAGALLRVNRAGSEARLAGPRR